MKFKKFNNFLHKSFLLSKGIKYSSIKEYMWLKQKGINLSQKQKDILFSLPLNGMYERLLNNAYNTKLVFEPFGYNFPDMYFLIYSSKNSRHILDLKNGKERITPDKLFDFLKKNDVMIKSSHNSFKNNNYCIEYKNNRFHINSKESTKDEIRNVLFNTNDNLILIKKPDSITLPGAVSNYKCPMLHICLQQKNPESINIIDSYICEHFPDDKFLNFSNIRQDIDINAFGKYKNTLLKMSYKVFAIMPQLQYVDLVLYFHEGNWKVFQINSGLDFAVSTNPSNLTVDKKKINFKSILNLYNYIFAAYAKKKGFEDYMYKYWLKDLYKDLIYYKQPLKDKIWAYKRGFYSFRINQYGLNENNYKSYISDYEYKRSRPLNNNICARWLTDKLATYYMMHPYKDILPQYYYFIESSKNNTYIYPASSEKRNNVSITDFFEFLKTNRTTVLKKTTGSHGTGFYKIIFNASTDDFSVNNTKKTIDELKHFIEELNGTFIVSEYIEMHDKLKNIYDKVTCTIRVMTINDGTVKNKVRHAYFRLATNESGITDNISSGGICVKVDINNGEMYDPEFISNHKFYECKTHPDTGKKIEGFIPYWNEVVKKINDICDYLYPLEYLGFDVVITNNGFKILEINTHQDLHKYAEYPDDVKKYLLDNTSL